LLGEGTSLIAGDSPRLSRIALIGNAPKKIAVTFAPAAACVLLPKKLLSPQAKVGTLNDDY
jgi:hypothetical protein